MSLILASYLLIFTLSALGCLVSLRRAMQIQHPGTREGMVGFLLSVALWCVGYIGYLLMPTADAKLALYTIGFIFAFLAVVFFLYFCAAYTGRPPHQAPYKPVFIGGILFVIGLKVTNPLHRGYYTGEWATAPFPHLAIQHHVLYWITLGVSYVAIAVGFFMLFERFYHTGADSRPLVALVGITGIPAAVTILGSQVDWLLPLIYEPPGVALFAVGMLFVYRRRFEAIQLTSESDAPAIFLDPDGRIRDFNHSAVNQFPGLTGAIGEPFDSVTPAIETAVPPEDVLTIQTAEGPRHYQVTRSPFTSGEAVTGHLVTFTDVTERETYRQQLETKTAQLEALNRLVRHDIRNDMTVIHGWAETLEDKVAPAGEDALERVLERSRHTIDFTERVREYVAALSGDAAVDLEPVSLSQHLEEAVLAARASYPDAEFTVEEPVPETTVRATEMLSSVFRNLLENAVRHSDDVSSEVVISCTETADAVRIRVADNGPGIPDAEKAAIFEMGEKGLGSTGSGMGLYLVATLTDQFGGSIRVEDNDPKGAVFVLELPKPTGDGSQESPPSEPAQWPPSTDGA